LVTDDESPGGDSSSPALLRRSLVSSPHLKVGVSTKEIR
jgi:hypothetical protein